MISKKLFSAVLATLVILSIVAGSTVAFAQTETATTNATKNVTKGAVASAELHRRLLVKMLLRGQLHRRLHRPPEDSLACRALRRHTE